MMIMKKEILAFALAIMTSFGMLGMMPTTTADDVTVTASVSCYKTMTFNYNAVAYGSQSAGAENVAAPNQADQVYNVTADTNCNYKVSASGTDFSDGGGHTFAVSNLRMDTATTGGGLALGDSKALSGSPQDIDTGYTPSDTLNVHGYWLSIPADQFGASYSSTVSITYANV
jgi:hypothetical protein